MSCLPPPAAISGAASLTGSGAVIMDSSRRQGRRGGAALISRAFGHPAGRGTLQHPRLGQGGWLAATSLPAVVPTPDFLPGTGTKVSGEARTGNRKPASLARRGPNIEAGRVRLPGTGRQGRLTVNFSRT